jgi:hypothetical protein
LPFEELEIRAINACADAAASRALEAAWASGELARVGATVIREWTARSLRRQHAGLIRQRKKAGFLGGFGDDAAQQPGSSPEGPHED